MVPWGLVLPKNTPVEVLNWYSDKFKQAIKEPGVRDNLSKSFIFVNEELLTPKAFNDYVFNQYKQHKSIVDIITKNN